MAVGEVAVKVVDRAQAIAAQRQRVGHHPEAVLAEVEGVLAVGGLLGIGVGNEHLRNRPAIKDGTSVVGDRIEHETFAGVEPDVQRPLLPADVVPGHGEARAVGLR